MVPPPQPTGPPARPTGAVSDGQNTDAADVAELRRDYAHHLNIGLPWPEQGQE